MKKVFDFGKIDYSGKGRKAYPVTVEMRFKDGNLAISGDIWNTKKTDIVCGGQCLDTINEYLKDNDTFKKLFYLWQNYHLNDLHPECKHQRDLGWNIVARKQVQIKQYGRTETKGLGWLKPEEHPDGILTKACPVCGYRYGTKWLKMPIPQ